MANETFERSSPRQSRRSFLARLALGAAALAAVSVPLGRLGRGKRSDADPLAEAFPGEDSIFHPAHDPRLDPRRPRT